MYNTAYSDHLLEIMRKLSKKNKSLYEQLLDKIDEIKNCYDVEHYKNLRFNMKDSKSFHLGHFVIVFQFNKTTNTINFDDFDHHDVIYKK